MTPPLLSEALPALAVELEGLLANEGHVDLAMQIGHLRVLERCTCGDAVCGTFYTEPRPTGPWGEGHRNMLLNTTAGMIILDVVHGKITCVEVLDRDDIREKVDELFARLDPVVPPGS